MATYIKTLKEDNGDIVYPQTITNAIYTSGGETLETRISKYVTAEDIAQSVAALGTVTTSMVANNAITTAKIADEAVTSQKIDFTTLDFGNYSTTEVDTGFTWVDGKHIYKKTINFGALPNNMTKSVAHNISNLGYVVKHEGYCQDSSGNRLPIPIVGSSLASILITDLNVTIVTSSDRTAFTTCYITLYYTKSS